MNKKLVRLEDIAKKLNVSKVTVSKALRNHPDISSEMTEKIKKIAEKIGYYPNRHASNLSSQRSQTIGVIIPKIAHYFFSSIIESVYDTVLEKNYEAIVMVSQENAAREKKHLESLISMRVDGILVSISQNTQDYSIFEAIKRMNIPLVFFDRVVQNMGLSCVSVNDRKGAYEMIDHVIKLGYTKIAHLSGPMNINIGYERYTGYEQALKQNGIPLRPDWVVEGGFGETDGYTGFMKLYNKGKLPELIFAVTFPVALGILNAAKEVGINIPEDLNVVCFGRSDYNHIIKPNISCVVQPTKELAVKSVEVLLSEIERTSGAEPKNIMLDTKLEIYDTFLPKK